MAPMELRCLTKWFLTQICRSSFLGFCAFRATSPQQAVRCPSFGEGK